MDHVARRRICRACFPMADPGRRGLNAPGLSFIKIVHRKKEPSHVSVRVSKVRVQGLKYIVHGASHSSMVHDCDVLIAHLEVVL